MAMLRYVELGISFRSGQSASKMHCRQGLWSPDFSLWWETLWLWHSLKGETFVFCIHFLFSVFLFPWCYLGTSWMSFLFYIWGKIMVTRETSHYLSNILNRSWIPKVNEKLAIIPNHWKRDSVIQWNSLKSLELFLRALKILIVEWSG